MHHDVVVLGDGPAGSALAKALTVRGVDVCLLGGDEAWAATYGTWADDVEVLTWFDTSSIWAYRLDSITVDAGGHRVIDRPYGVVDNNHLRRVLRTGVTHRSGHAVDIELRDLISGDDDVVTLVSGEHITASVVVDATGWPGWRRRATAPDGSRDPAPADALLDPPRQTAFGVVLAAAPAGPLGTPMLMDFSTAPGHGDDGLGPSFAYALPTVDGWLVEETVLVARPAVPADALAGRLAARLGVSTEQLHAMATTVERVDIPMGGPLPDRDTPLLAFGAAASMIHPATGYSLAVSLERADPVAAAIVAELERPTPNHRRVWDVIWPISMRRTRLLHDYGLGVLLALDVVDTRSFFSAFFELDEEEWAAYLRITTPPRRLARVMASMFGAAPRRLRRRLVSQNPLAFARLFRPG